MVYLKGKEVCPIFWDKPLFFVLAAGLDRRRNILKNISQGGDKRVCVFSIYYERVFTGYSISHTEPSITNGECTLKTTYDLKTSPCSSHHSEVFKGRGQAQSDDNMGN